jgi:transcriptional regulator with XRE-family HTH domain
VKSSGRTPTPWGQQVIEHMGRAGIGQAELARKAGYSRPTISQAINGTRASRGTANNKPSVKLTKSISIVLGLNHSDSSALLHLAHMEHASPYLRRYIYRLEEQVEGIAP